MTRKVVKQLERSRAKPDLLQIDREWQPDLLFAFLSLPFGEQFPLQPNRLIFNLLYLYV